MDASLDHFVPHSQMTCWVGYRVLLDPEHDLALGRKRQGGRFTLRSPTTSLASDCNPGDGDEQESGDILPNIAPLIPQICAQAGDPY